MITQTITQTLPIEIGDLAVASRAHEDIEKRALDWPSRAGAVKIIDQASYDSAIDLLRAAKALRGEAEEHHRPMIDAAYKSHKTAIAQFKKIDDPLSSAETLIKTKIGIWDREQEMRRLEAERKAREEAERIAAEQFERELEAIEAAGAKPEEVTALIEEADRMPVYAPVVAPTYQKARGVSTRGTWGATVNNLNLLIQWIAKNPNYSSLLKIDHAALNALARAQQSNLRIPGVTVACNTSVAVR